MSGCLPPSLADTAFGSAISSMLPDDKMRLNLIKGYPSDKGVIPSLGGLRAISISIVLVSHAGYESIVPGGLGVTIFFFLSRRHLDSQGGALQRRLLVFLDWLPASQLLPRAAGWSAATLCFGTSRNFGCRWRLVSTTVVAIRLSGRSEMIPKGLSKRSPHAVGGRH
jgi:hypothetical protein